MQRTPLKDQTINIRSRYLLSQHRLDIDTFMLLGLEELWLPFATDQTLAEMNYIFVRYGEPVTN